MTAQCEGMGEVGSARYKPALLPPCPSMRVLSYSNCQEIHSRQQTGLAVSVLNIFYFIDMKRDWAEHRGYVETFSQNLQIAPRKCWACVLYKVDCLRRWFTLQVRFPSPIETSIECSPVYWSLNGQYNRMRVTSKESGHDRWWSTERSYFAIVFCVYVL